MNQEYKDLIIETLDKEINSIYVPKGALGVSEQLLNHINEDLDRRRKLIEARREVMLL